MPQQFLERSHIHAAVDGKGSEGMPEKVGECGLPQPHFAGERRKSGEPDPHPDRGL